MSKVVKNDTDSVVEQGKLTLAPGESRIVPDDFAAGKLTEEALDETSEAPKRRKRKSK